MSASVAGMSSTEYLTGGGGVAQGMENYYAGASAPAEPLGKWSGDLAKEAGLDGVVTPAVMAHVYGKFEAPDGTKLGRAPGEYGKPDARLEAWQEEHPDALPEEVEAARRSIEATTRTPKLGWDVTTSVPKSVSAAWAAAKRQEHDAANAAGRAPTESVRLAQLDRARQFRARWEAIESAVDRANSATLNYLSTITVARAGKHGGAGTAGRWVKAPGLIVSSFFQHTSRNIDPQLHTHNPVANRARCEDGEIRALDGADLLRQQHALSAVFDRNLAEELAGAGFEMEMRDTGAERPSWEIKAVDQKVCEIFSSRRRDIRGKVAELAAEAQERLGRELTDYELFSLRKEVTLATRKGKAKEAEPMGKMLSRWHKEVKDSVGSGLNSIADKILRPAAPQAAAEFSPTGVITAAVAAVSERGPSWRRSDLMGEIQQRLPLMGPGLSPEDRLEILERLTDQALSNRQVVTQVAGAELVRVPETIAQGGSYVRPAEVRYASTATLTVEQQLRAATAERGRHHIPAKVADAWLDENARTVGTDQRAMIVGTASSDAALCQWIGPAGTGKSFTAGTFSAMWSELSGGGRVQGLAVAQIAADVLKADGVQVTANVSAWLDTQKRLASGKPRAGDEEFVVRHNDVVMIDEASMIGTANLVRVREHVEAAGARLVLTGDPRQLASVEAGGAMGLLEDHAETYALTDVRRFRETWEGPASLRLRDGDADVLAEYERHGRIVDCDSIDAAIEQVARFAAAERLEDRTVVVTTGTNEEAARVAGAVREHLVAAGVVEADGVDLENHGGTAGVGDLVMCRQNDRRIGVTNRQLYSVTEVREDGSLVAVGRDTGQLVQLPARYVSEHVASGYAGTVHANEGVTVDAGYGITAGQIGAAGQYVMSTRGRDMNKVFVATGVKDEDPSKAQAVRTNPDGTIALTEASGDTERPSGRAVLEDALRREAVDDKAATVVREEDEALARSPSTLLGRIEDGVRVACRGRLESQLDTLAALGVLDESTRAALGADQATEHLSRLLRAAEQAGHDPGALLSHAALDERGFDGVISPAQTLSARISATVERGTGARPATSVPVAAEVPSGLPGPSTAYLERLHEVARDRQREIGSQVAEESPDWAARTLGPVPSDPTERLEWEHKAGKVGWHREATGWDDPSRALGPASGITSTERRASWHEAFEALGRPEEEREEATLTDGQLRLRIQVAEREQRMAPAHTNDALKASSLAAEEARVAGVLEPSRSDKHEAEQKRQEEIRDVAKEGGEAREAWHTHVGTMLDKGARARAELEERGQPINQEPDRISPAEWLHEQRLADGIEDGYRPVTEVDVVDETKDRELAAGVEERADDLAMVERTRPEQRPRAAQQVMSEEPDAAELDDVQERAGQVLEEIAYRDSLSEPDEYEAETYPVEATPAPAEWAGPELVAEI